MSSHCSGSYTLVPPLNLTIPSVSPCLRSVVNIWFARIRAVAVIKQVLTWVLRAGPRVLLDLVATDCSMFHVSTCYTTHCIDSVVEGLLIDLSGLSGIRTPNQTIPVCVYHYTPWTMSSPCTCVFRCRMLVRLLRGLYLSSSLCTFRQCTDGSAQSSRQQSVTACPFPYTIIRYAIFPTQSKKRHPGFNIRLKFFLWWFLRSACFALFITKQRTCT